MCGPGRTGPILHGRILEPLTHWRIPRRGKRVQCEQGRAWVGKPADQPRQESSEDTSFQEDWGGCGGAARKCSWSEWSQEVGGDSEWSYPPPFRHWASHSDLTFVDSCQPACFPEKKSETRELQGQLQAHRPGRR